MAQTLEPGAVDEASLSLSDLRGRPKKRRREWFMRALFRSAAIFSFLISILIILTVVREAWSFMSEVDPSSLLAIGWFPRRGFYDIPTLVIGTMLVTGIAMVVAIPLGLAVAIYLAEYAKPRVRNVVKPVLEVLAGIPSVVLGYFAISFITPELLTPFFEVGFFNMAAAGLAVGVLTLPIVASVSEDAMRAVPLSLREASYGMGARKITTSLRVVIPAAISGIVAAVIIAISRAIGETMVVAIASGATGGSLRSWDVLEPGQTMTAAMAALGAGTDQVKGDDLAFQSLFFVGLLLFIITLGLNIVGNWFVSRLREKY